MNDFETKSPLQNFTLLEGSPGMGSMGMLPNNIFSGKTQKKGGENIMMLLTKELLARFAKVGRQEQVKDPLVVAKFFNPCGAGTWYATEYDPEERIFFGYVSIFGDWNDEWGSFSLDELQSYTGKFGIGIERDLYFDEKRISEVVPSAKQ